VKSPQEGAQNGRVANSSLAIMESMRSLGVNDMEEDGSGMLFSDSSSVLSSVTAG